MDKEGRRVHRIFMEYCEGGDLFNFGRTLYTYVCSFLCL
jgi:hypothetical protein